MPFPPGGGTDVGTRVIAQKLQESLGQPVRGGEPGRRAGILGTELTAKAAPDGYTLMMGNIGTHAINVSLYLKLSYDPVKDFTPISQVAGLPMLLLVHPSVKANSIVELIALAKANPGDAQLFQFRRRRHAARLRGTVRQHDRHPDRSHSLQGRRAGGRRPDRWPRIDVLRHRAGKPAAGEGGRLRALAVSSAKRSVAAA